MPINITPVTLPGAALLAGALLLLPTAALAADEVKRDSHGAALAEDQQRALEALQKGRDPLAVPANVDPLVWAASIPKDNALTPERIDLGRRLYFDTALSKDGTVACATCHDVTRSFTDRRPVAEGVGGKLGRRNAPTTLNAALLHSQFLDSRAATLEVQAGQPILNSVEMAMPSEAAAVAALQKKGYDEAFQKAYGRKVNYRDIERAIASFERTLVFLEAPFDRFLAGDRKAISEDAHQGWMLFNGKGRCVTCHTINQSMPLGTDNRAHNIGVSARHQDFEQLARKALAALKADPSLRQLDELAIATNMSELGRFMVTRNEGDIGAFRTSQLRNVGITAPYMHDGSMQTLWDTMDHYNKGGEPNHYLDGGVEPLALSEKEIDQVVAFMFTLTDSRFAEQNAKEEQRQRDLASKQRPFRNDELANRKLISFGRRPEDKKEPTTPSTTPGGAK
jgi:cytochrome c peroxidase